MTTLALDTYALVTKLKEAGVPEQQAAAQVETLIKALDSALEQVRHKHDLDNLVTNKDLDVRIRETQLKIELLRSELKHDIAETKTELIRWVLVVGVLQMTLITVLMLKLTNLI